MKAYEIINPSDSYILQAPDLELAAAAVMVLGEGKYALRDEEGNDAVPLFLFGGSENWLQATFGDPSFEHLLDRTAKARREEFIAVLDSVMIGGFKDIKSYEAALRNIPTEKGKAKFKEEWLDIRRGSLNNIGGYAKQLADHFRKKRALVNE